MLDTTTTVVVQGISKDESEQQEILGMEARLEYDGSVNINKRFPNRILYNQNKESAEADYKKFESYANAIFDQLSNTTKEEG